MSPPFLFHWHCSSGTDLATRFLFSVTLFFPTWRADTGRLLAIPQRLLAEVPHSAMAKIRNSPIIWRRRSTGKQSLAIGTA